MIAIHHNDSTSLFHYRWAAYCEENQIPYKRVNCYANDIIYQLKDCDALLWHYHQNNPRDILMAKPLLFALQQSRMKVFPDFNTAWHFDDKVGQKYLLEAIGVPLVPTWVFYSKQEALEWAAQTSYPKVFKLRGGAGSQNVKLVPNKEKCNSLIHKAFGKGFKAYDPWESLHERFRKYRLGKNGFKEVIKGLVRLVVPPPYSKQIGNQKGYIYFQEFMPNNDHDVRVIVINDKAFAIKRMVRQGDFRASGSGFIKYEKGELDEKCVKISFDVSQKLITQCVALDFVYDFNKNPLLVEISYGFANAGYDSCTGYWDKEMNWYEGTINPYGWMIQSVLYYE